MICPDCLGMCGVDEIKLIYAIYDDKEVFMCPRCRRFYRFEQIDEEDMEDLEKTNYQNMRNELISDELEKKQGCGREWTESACVKTEPDYCGEGDNLCPDCDKQDAEEKEDVK